MLCECKLCTCDVAGKFAADREEKKIHQFLIGLDDHLYATVRTNVMSQSPPTDLDRLYPTLVQEERLQDIARGKAVKEEVHAFVAVKEETT